VAKDPNPSIGRCRLVEIVNLELNASLERLEGALRGYGAPIVDAFRPGLDPSHVSDALRSEGLDPHPDALTWFGWHDAAEIAPPVRADDGTVVRYGGETVLVGPWWMFTLAQALETRRMHLRILRDVIDLHGDHVNDPALVESWLPIATSEGAGELCLDTAAADAAPLYVLDQESLHEGTPQQFVSLAEFAAAMTRAVEQGHVIPHPFDSRAAMIDSTGLPDDLRPLAYW
jgi:hypothetical protein